MNQICTWTRDSGWDAEDVWETACGEAYVFLDGGPADNKMRFCGYCGKLIDVRVTGLEDSTDGPIANEGSSEADTG